MYHILTRPGCDWCNRAHRLLNRRRLPFTEEVFDTPEKQAAFKAAGHPSYPRIYKDDELIGGYMEFEASLM